MQDPVIRDVFNYWEGLRAGRLAPLRSELDPYKISHVIDHVFVLEYKNPLVVRFRLAGMGLCRMLGMELRGMPARALFEIGHRDELGRVLDDMVTAPKIIELVLKSPSHDAPTLNARMLLLPMQNAEGQYSRILGCLVSDDPPLQRPARFDIHDVKTTRIVGAMDVNATHRGALGFDGRDPTPPDSLAHRPAQGSPQGRQQDSGHTIPSASDKPKGFQDPAPQFEGLHRPKSGTKSTTRRLAVGKPYLRLIKNE
ncbi:PAS domain-containing protein [Neptunicoccus sediminis]|uniref:PAS domain-containing protein n=1 Tax=Neptunicoccus sediminis TaxID=1892596 RepID=UPI0012FF99C7|nr:PAS domain-containing protein [Neptunicoccus sediminis]